jgi:Transposase IS66 family
MIAGGARAASCGTQTRAAFPEGVTAPVQYGKRIGAFVLYLLHYQLLPEKRLTALMADLFGVRLVTATIARISQDCAHRFMGFADAVRDHVAAAPVKHLDETGFRTGGKTQWLHIASTVWLTFYRVSARRGSLLPKVTGIVVHDHWKPYYTMTGVLHALCELNALVEIEKEDWARKMQRLLRRACHAANLAHQQGVPLKAGLIALLDRCYDTILAEGLAFHQAQPALAKVRRRGRQPRRVGHNLLLRLSTRRLDVLRFLTDPSVPFTNNLAEQDGRMMKLRQKISGGFRSGWCEGFRRHPLGSLHCQKAGLEYAADLDHCPNAPDHRHPAGLIRLFATWAVTPKVILPARNRLDPGALLSEQSFTRCRPRGTIDVRWNCPLGPADWRCDSDVWAASCSCCLVPGRPRSPCSCAKGKGQTQRWTVILGSIPLF